jgi:hypothetical protein
LDPLILFLVDNNYADNYRSAEKILEHISEEFYNTLIGQIINEANSASVSVSQLRRQAEEARRKGDMVKYAELAAQMNQAMKASKEENKNNTPDPRKTADSRTSWVSGNRQTPQSGRRGAPDPRDGKRNRNIERAADELIGNSVPKPTHLGSNEPAHMQGGNTSWAASGDRRSERRGVTGQSNRERRSGATGRYENPNRFDDRPK